MTERSSPAGAMPAPSTPGAIPLLWDPATHAAFNAAEENWQQALVQNFGRRAGTARYLPEGKGTAGSTLRVAHDRRMDAMRAWHRSIDAYSDKRNMR